MNRRLQVWALVVIDLAAAAACVGVVLLFTYILPQGRAAAQDAAKTDIGAQFSLPSAGSARGLDVPPASTNDWSHADTLSMDAAEDEIEAFRAAEKTRETVQEYSGKTTELTIERVSCLVDGEPLVYFSADIYVTGTQYIKTAFAQATYGRNIRDYVDRMARENNALLAISGDSYGESSRTCVIRNGTLYSSDPGTSDVCVLYADGVMRTVSPVQFDAEQAMRDGAWQAWTFGPALLDGSGEILPAFHSTEYLNKPNPRCAIGYAAPGHYKFVLVDGRQDGYSAGATISQLAALMQEEGCLTAYNLDGGKSAVMVYDGKWVNHPIGMGREISDCIYIGAEEESP